MMNISAGSKVFSSSIFFQSSLKTTFTIYLYWFICRSPLNILSALRPYRSIILYHKYSCFASSFFALRRAALLGNLFTASCRVHCFYVRHFIQCFGNLVSLLYQRILEKSNNKGLYNAICRVKSFEVICSFLK